MIEIRRRVFGPFWYVLRPLRLVSVQDVGSLTKAQQAQGWAIFLATTLPLLARTLWFFYLQMKDDSLSLGWCYTTSLFFFALHGCVMRMCLGGLGRTGVYKALCEKLHDVVGLENFSGVKFLDVILMFIRIQSFLAFMGCFCAENFIELFAHGSNVPLYRKSILAFISASPFLYAFDAATIMLGAFCSVAALIIIYLLNSAIAKAIKQLRKQVDELTSAASLETCTSQKITESIHYADSRLVDLLDMLKIVNDSPMMHNIYTLTLLCALLIFVASLFALQTSTDAMTVLQIVKFVGWVILSSTMLAAVKRWTAKPERLLSEIKDKLLLSKRLWNTETKGVAETMVTRIDRVGYKPRVFFTIPISDPLVVIAITALPFFVTYLVVVQRRA